MPAAEDGSAAEQQAANPCAQAEQVLHAKGTVELWEGTVRQIYVDKPLVGAKGYFVSDLAAGHGTLTYDSGEDLYAQGLNMIMVFGKNSEGSHEGPEDFGELIVERNGPIMGARGIAPMELRVLEGSITVRPAS